MFSIWAFRTINYLKKMGQVVMWYDGRNYQKSVAEFLQIKLRIEQKKAKQTSKRLFSPDQLISCEITKKCFFLLGVFIIR